MEYSVKNFLLYNLVRRIIVDDIVCILDLTVFRNSDAYQPIKQQKTELLNSPKKF